MTDARLAGLLFGAAFLVRLTLYLGTAIFGTDSAQFLLMADWMKTGEYDRALSVTYHPLYPLLVSMLQAFLPASPEATEQAGFWVSMVFGAAATVPLFLLVRAIFGRPAAFLTALLYAFQWHTVEVQADVMTEGVFCFFLFGSAWLTWRAMDEPSPERFVVAGTAAAAAFLTRAEGILAVALAALWPVADLVWKRDRRALRLGGAAACAAASLLLMSPFLLWVHGKTGKWQLSAKLSVRQAGETVGREALSPEEEKAKEGGGRYGKLGRSMAQVAGATLPFLLLGLAGLRDAGPRGLLFYFSFPLGYLAGLLLALRTHPWMSYRYVIPPMGMLFAVAALGMILAFRFLARRVPEPRSTWIAAAMVLAVAFLPCVRAFRPHRQEEVSLREAGEWIRRESPGGAHLFSTRDKLGYFAGNVMNVYPVDFEAMKTAAARVRPDFFVYFDHDLKKAHPPYLSRLAELGTGAPVVFPRDPRPGVTRVFVQPAR